MSSKRITFTMDEKIVSKLRKLQAKQIADTSQPVSLSKIVDALLREALK